MKESFTNNSKKSNTASKLLTTTGKTSWLLIFLIILLLGTNGIFIYKYYQAKQQQYNQSINLSSCSQLMNAVASPSLTVVSPKIFSSPSPEDSKALEQQVYEAWINSKGAPLPEQKIITSNVQIISDWAMGSVIATAVSDGAPQAYTFMGHKVDEKWNVALEYTPIYLDWFKQAGSQFYEDQKKYEFMRDQHYRIP